MYDSPVPSQDSVPVPDAVPVGVRFVGTALRHSMVTVALAVLFDTSSAVVVVTVAVLMIDVPAALDATV